MTSRHLFCLCAALTSVSAANGPAAGRAAPTPKPPRFTILHGPTPVAAVPIDGGVTWALAYQQGDAACGMVPLDDALAFVAVSVADASGASVPGAVEGFPGLPGVSQLWRASQPLAADATYALHIDIDHAGLAALAGDVCPDAEPNLNSVSSFATGSSPAQSAQAPTDARASRVRCGDVQQFRLHWSRREFTSDRIVLADGSLVEPELEGSTFSVDVTIDDPTTGETCFELQSTQHLDGSSATLQVCGDPSEPATTNVCPVVPVYEACAGAPVKAPGPLVWLLILLVGWTWTRTRTRSAATRR